MQKSAKWEFNDGFYSQRAGRKKQKVYIDIVEETIRIHPTILAGKNRVVDSTQSSQDFNKELKNNYYPKVSFNKPSFDVDFLTIPLKYRSSMAEVPAQLNTNLNGALFLGYRYDNYRLNYQTNPLGNSERSITHFGFSCGAFTGLGNTFMSPTNTRNVLQQEYDGVVWSKGLAGILAINNFTVGFALGYDFLLDKNKSFWIYQNKPWLGLAFGLNLN